MSITSLQEEIQITEVNSEESLDLSNITSDIEKLEELMGVIFQGADEESIRISQGNSEQISRKETLKSRSNSRHSNQSPNIAISKARSINQKSLQKSRPLQFKEDHLPISGKPTSNSSVKISPDEQNVNQVFMFNSIKENEENQNSQEKKKENQQGNQIIFNIDQDISSARTSEFQNLVQEAQSDYFNKPRRDFSFMNTRRSTETETYQKNMTKQSLESNEQIYPNFHQFQRKPTIQSQFGELPNQQDFVCGCITQAQTEETEEKNELCTIL